MSRAKRSVSFPAELEDTIAALAEARGESFSAWLVDAARRKLAVEAKHAEAMAGIAEYETEHGPLPVEELARAEAALIAAGVLPAGETERKAS